MIPNPIHKVLSTLYTHEVQYLLMGGQACVLYGAAEFSRDCDIVIVCDGENLDKLRGALRELRAATIAVPEFDAKYLQQGHAVHFRCTAPDVAGMRLDVMARLRGVDAFEEIWQRRTTLEDDAGVRIELMALSDLVKAKKTQRDKDWPMLRRLVEAHYSQHKSAATEEQVRFWLLEARTPDLLIELAANYPENANNIRQLRPLLSQAIDGDNKQLESLIVDEERREREADRLYWEPLKRDLEQLRRQRRL